MTMKLEQCQHSKQNYSSSMVLDKKALWWFFSQVEVDPAKLNWEIIWHFLNIIQIYSLKVIKLSFSHLFVGKLFWTGKNIWG